MVRLIALDLDGTLLAGKSNIPQKNIDALHRAMEAGVHVVIASGRMLEATLPIAERLGVNAPLILFNGAMIYDMRTERILSGSVLPCARAREVLRAVEAGGHYVQAFPGRGYFFERRCDRTAYYEDKIGVTGSETGIPLSEWLQTDVYKLLVLEDPEKLLEMQARMSQMFPDIDFIRSGATHLEIVARGIDKGAGLAKLCAHLGVRADEAMAFGDEQNDVPMLRYAKYGYIMENAADALKAQFCYIAPRNTACGVAKIVNMYLDEKRMGG